MAAMNSPILSGAMVSNALFGVPSAVYASSATWNLNPTSGEWNTAANWTRATVSDSPRDVATFGLSNQTSVVLNAKRETRSNRFRRRRELEEFGRELGVLHDWEKLIK